MNYVYVSSTDNICIFSNRDAYYHSLGEGLFSFLEMDLTDFEECFKEISITNSNYDFPVINSIYDSLCEHPYVKYSKDFLHECLRNNDIEKLVDNFHLSKIQSEYKELLYSCLIDGSKLVEDASPIQNYYFYLYTRDGIIGNVAHGIHYTPFLSPNTVEALNEAKNHKEKVEIAHDTISDGIKTFLCVSCDTISDFLYYEFYEMVIRNIKIKKCENCGKFFVMKGDYNTDYCDRIPEGETQTCKRIAAINTRKKKLQSNPILLEFQKAYKRNFARVSSKKLTTAEFSTWTREATKQRDIVSEQYTSNPSEQILKEFKDYLGNK